jgi:hypothetical protein
MLIDIVDGRDHLLMSKVAGRQVAAGCGTIIAWLMWGWHGHEDPIALVDQIGYSGNLYAVTLSGGYVIAQDRIMPGEYFSTVKAQFAKTNETNRLHFVMGLEIGI